MSKRIESSRIMETLVQNARKGEPYRVKLVDDPVVYEGIPLSTPGDATRDPDTFRLEVTSPSEDAGLMYGRISDIEWIERVR
ncbi:MAG TPA: hypothetical protein VLS88_06720 [Polyangiales bacterium]|nr:hypothetical protein [Polyangiales bacterium]